MRNEDKNESCNGHSVSLCSVHVAFRPLSRGKGHLSVRTYSLGPAGGERAVALPSCCGKAQGPPKAIRGQPICMHSAGAKGTAEQCQKLFNYGATVSSKHMLLLSQWNETLLSPGASERQCGLSWACSLCDVPSMICKSSKRPPIFQGVVCWRCRVCRRCETDED